MTPLTVIAMAMLVVSGCFFLGMNFSTRDAPPAYRRAMYVNFCAFSGSATFVYFEQIDNLWAIIVPCTSLCYALYVTSQQRLEGLTRAERWAILSKPAFRRAVLFSAATLLFMGVLVTHHYVGHSAETPLEDAMTDSLQTAPGTAEIQDRAAWENLKNQKP